MIILHRGEAACLLGEASREHNQRRQGNASLRLRMAASICQRPRVAFERLSAANNAANEGSAPDSDLVSDHDRRGWAFN